MPDRCKPTNGWTKNGILEHVRADYSKGPDFARCAYLTDIEKALEKFRGGE